MVISTTVSPLLSTLTGELMGMGINWLFGSLMLYGVALQVISRAIIGGFEREKKIGDDRDGLEMNLMTK